MAYVVCIYLHGSFKVDVKLYRAAGGLECGPSWVMRPGKRGLKSGSAERIFMGKTGSGGTRHVTKHY